MAIGDPRQLTAQRVGIWLGSVRNRIADDFRIVKRQDKNKKIAVWSVQPV